MNGETNGRSSGYNRLATAGVEVKVFWGVFEDVDEGVRHVVPVDKADNIVGGHLIEEECFCNPKIQYSEHGMMIVVHNLPN